MKRGTDIVNIPALAFPLPSPRKTAVAVIVLLAIAGAYALALLNHPAPVYVGTPLYAMNRGASPALLDRKASVGVSHSGTQSGQSAYIIRTGGITIRLRAKSVLGAQTKLENLLKGYAGAYVASASAYDHNKYLDLDIDVPATAFSTVMFQLQHDYGKVQSLTTSSQNVGLQVVNLNARLTNLSAQRGALLKLFLKSTSVSDTVRVEKVLSSVEGQIEQIQGQIKYLDHQVAMSTISIEFQAKTTSKHHVSNAIFNAFGKAGSGIVSVIAGAIVVIGYAIPLSVLGLSLYGLVLLVLAIRRRRLAPAVAVTAS